MSLINQMLQDLDARQAAHGAGVKLPGEVRPLPPDPASRWPWMALALAGGVVIAAGSVFFLSQEASEPPVLPATLTQPPAALADATTVSTVPAADSASAVSEERPESDSPSAQKTEQPVLPPALGVSLRIADALAEPSKKQRGTRKDTDTSLPLAKNNDEKQDSLARRPAQAQAAPASSPSLAAPVADDRAAKTVSIEKTDAAAQPRDRVEAAYRKAIAAVNQGRVNEALDALQEVLRQDNLHVAARQLRVRLLLEAGRTEEAVQALRDGLQALPAQTGWAMSLARLQVERGEVAAAAQTLQYSMPVASANPDYLGFTGHVLQRLGRYKEAAELYQTAARIAPGDGRWWLGLGLAMEAEGRNDQAVAAFQRAHQSGNLSRELMTLVEQKLR